MAERVPAHNEEQVATFAKCATVSQLRKVLCKQLFTFPDQVEHEGDARSTTDVVAAGEPLGQADPDAPRPLVDSGDLAARVAAAEAAPTLLMGDDGSRFFLHLDASLELGALVRQALAEARDRLFDAGQPTVSWADAMPDVCGRSLGAAPQQRRSHYRVQIHLDTAGAWRNAGPVLPPNLARKVTCDGRVAPVWRRRAGPSASAGRCRSCPGTHAGWWRTEIVSICSRGATLTVSSKCIIG